MQVFFSRDLGRISPDYLSCICILLKIVHTAVIDKIARLAKPAPIQPDRDHTDDKINISPPAYETAETGRVHPRYGPGTSPEQL